MKTNYTDRIMDKMNVNYNQSLIILGYIVCNYGQLCIDMSTLLNKGLINSFPSKVDYINGVIDSMVKV